MHIKVEVIPWGAATGQIGVSVQRGTVEVETHLVGSRLEAEREANRLTASVIIFPGPKERRARYPR